METSNRFKVAEIELAYRPGDLLKDRPVITRSKDAFDIFFSTWDMNRICLNEQFKVLLLNRANRVLAMYEASSGGTTGTVVDIRLLLVAALKTNALSMILAHNHPSGNLKPSKADLTLTERIVSAARLMDIHVLDHLIISSDGYCSLADRGDI